jgi:hypothetical protein
MTESSMRLDLEVDLDLDPVDLAAAEQSVTAVAAAWWSDLGTPGDLRVVVQGKRGEGNAIRANGSPLHLSAWRRSQAYEVAALRSDLPDSAAVAASITDTVLRLSSEEVVTEFGVTARYPSGGTESIVVELPDRLARQLTSLDAEAPRDRLAPVVTDIARQFGVVLPQLTLAIADWPEPAVRLRFGGLAEPRFAVTEDDPMLMLDQLATQLSVEARRHLSLWVQPEVPLWLTGLTDLPETGTRVARLLPELQRRLLTDQVGICHDQLLVEAVLRVLADVDDRVERGADLVVDGQALSDAIEDQARLLLGPAVVAEIIDLPTPIIEVIDLTRLAGRSGELRDELLGLHPQLLDGYRSTIVQVPASMRREVARALRPLSDSVWVVADTELRLGAAIRERWQAIESRRAGFWPTPGLVTA